MHEKQNCEQQGNGWKGSTCRLRHTTLSVAFLENASSQMHLLTPVGGQINVVKISTIRLVCQ